jgi:hypothetical protein
MIPNVKIKQSGLPPLTGAQIDKQIKYGTAVGLTKTIKAGQAAVVDSMRDKFTLRGSWFQQSSRVGIKVKTAKPSDLTAEVTTLADWLLKQKKGGNVFPFRNYLAIPTSNVKRSKRDVVTKANRPKNLKKSFVITTKNGRHILFQRKGRGKRSDIVAMYVLVPKVNIKPTDTFFSPADEIAKKHLTKNITAAIEKAIATAKR